VTDLSPRFLAVYPGFEARLRDKLQKGYEEHTDASFARMPEELVEELREECIDIAGWAMVLDTRIGAMTGHLETMRIEFAALQQDIEKAKQEFSAWDTQAGAAKVIAKRIEGEVVVLKRVREKLR
jgi:hypothetical protein